MVKIKLNKIHLIPNTQRQDILRRVSSFFALSSTLSDVLTIGSVMKVKNKITVDLPHAVSLPRNEETI
jgi:hypothetical protein